MKDISELREIAARLCGVPVEKIVIVIELSAYKRVLLRKDCGDVVVTSVDSVSADPVDSIVKALMFRAEMNVMDMRSREDEAQRTLDEIRTERSATENLCARLREIARNASG